MKKRLVPIIVVLVILVGAAAYLRFKKDDKNSPIIIPASKKTAATNAHYKTTDACDILTLAGATQILGTGTVKTDSVGISNTSTDSISVSSCNYYIATPSFKSVNLLARSAKDAAGVAANKAQFNTLPDGAEKVADLGDSAYWVQTYGQLHILKNNNWYILSSGPTKPVDNKLDDSKVLAKLVLPKL